MKQVHFQNFGLPHASATCDHGDVLQLSMLRVSPATAYLLLSSVTKLHPGDWILQTAPFSSVGQCVLQFSKVFGIGTINIVDTRLDHEAVIRLGGDVVLAAGPSTACHVKATKGNDPLRIAFDAVAGSELQILAECLDEGGQIINYDSHHAGEGVMKYSVIQFWTHHPRHWAAVALLILALSALAATPPAADSSIASPSPAQTTDHASSDDSAGDAIEHITPNPNVEKPATAVGVMVAHRESNSALDRSFTGSLVAKRASDLGFKRTGRVIKVHADQGDRIHQGDVIAELDTETIEAEMNVVRAQRAAAEAKLEELVAGPRSQTIEAAKARVDELKALRDQASMVYERRRKLAGGDAISQQDVDDARLVLAANEGRLIAQQQVLAELQEGTRKEQLQAQRAMVAQLDASLASLQVQLDESRLFAPFEALIARRMADEGTVVDPGTVIARLVELAAPEVWVGVPPEFISQVQIDQIQALTIRGKARQAKVQAILPELDMTTRTQTVIMQLLPDETSANDDLFSLGQIAQLHLKQTSAHSGFWLPLSALTQGVRGLWSAFVVVTSDTAAPAPDSTVRRVDLEILQIDTDQVLVTGTLQDGDRVVVAGVQKLANGQRVQVVAPEPSQPSQTE